jgi:hypothetical protein
MAIKMGHQSFEEFLMGVFEKTDGSAYNANSDRLVDISADWSAELHIDDVIKYAEDWMAQETAFNCEKCKRGE